MTIQNNWNRTLRAGTQVALGSDADGDIYYLKNGTLQRLAIGTAGQLLSIALGVPAWVTGAPPSGNAGGDLTGSYPNPYIAASAVTLSKLANASTSQILLGRNSAGSGTYEELSAATVRNLLQLGSAAQASTGTSQGNVPVLDSSGKLPSSVLPSITINQTYVVANATARLALSNINVGDIAKQTDNGVAYILQATPASTSSNWISIGDTSIDASDIVSGIIDPTRLGSGTASASTYLRGDQTWQPLPYMPVPFTDVTGTSITMAANNGYYPDNSGLVTLTLPTTAARDTNIEVVGVGSGGWQIAQNANQQIIFGNLSTTSGTSGRLNSTHQRDSLRLKCIVANTTWQVVTSVGNIDVN